MDYTKNALIATIFDKLEKKVDGVIATSQKTT